MRVMGTTSESEEQTVFKGGIGSPCLEEASSGGNVGFSVPLKKGHWTSTEPSVPLKKGPWTSTEDAILVGYVTKHGEGNWNAVQKHSGLARCGKSCRLRWTNHLRPNLKKYAFTPEEERRVIELHSKMGNKWAKMSIELPGRTDNEIKNYWNTRIKRRQREGLPIYPPDICLQALTESQSENISVFSSENPHPPDLLPVSGFEIPAVELSLDLDNRFCSPPMLNIPPCNLLDIPASSLLAEDVNSSYGRKYLLSAVQPTKRFRRSEPLLPGLHPSFSSAIPGCIRIHKDNSVPNIQSFGFSSEYYQNPTSNYPLSSSVPSVSHYLNGIPSSSKPTWAMKELPSLQTKIRSWALPSSPLHSLESVDTLIQSPPTESGGLSPRNSGLLDAVLYESQSLRNLKNDPCQQKPEVPRLPGEVLGNAFCDHHVAEWGSYPDPISPLGHSAASVFSNYTPVSGSSLDEPQSFETIPESKLNTEGEVIPTESNGSNSNGLIYSRPDFLLASNCFGPQTDHGNALHVERRSWGALLDDIFS